MNTSDLELVALSLTLRDVKKYRHVFNNLNPRLLALEKIIPDSWEWEKEDFVPTDKFNSISYKNKTLLLGGGDSLIAYQRTGLELGRSPELLSCFIKYIELMAPDAFDKAEIGWEFHVERKNPSTWIMSRFFQPNLIPKDWKEPQVIPTFNFQSRDAVVFYKFSVDEENKFVTINCQIHTASPVDDAGLSEWLSNYHDHETAVLTNLLQLTET